MKKIVKALSFFPLSLSILHFLLLFTILLISTVIYIDLAGIEGVVHSFIGSIQILLSYQPIKIITIIASITFISYCIYFLINKRKNTILN